MYFDKLSDLGIKLTRRNGSEKTKCPQCSDGRKNKADKPLSVNITAGDYCCHNCGWKGNVRSFSAKREFKKFAKPSPEMLKNIQLKDNVVSWFAARSISKATLDKFMIYVKEEWMPQTEKKENCICFPYFKMAKRFAATEIWKEDWFLDLPTEYKLFWFYILSTCDQAGFFKVNTKVFCATSNIEIDSDTAFELFNKGKNRIRRINGSSWLIEDFFKFQYGNKFNINNQMHVGIEKIYNNHGVGGVSRFD